MKTQVVEVEQAIGRLLGQPIFHPSGKKLLPKGRQISADDIGLLADQGLRQICVAILEEEDVAEEEAAIEIARRCAAGCLEIRVSAGGRANLIASENCCLLVDEQRLLRINSSGVATAATLPRLSYGVAAQRVGAVKTVPFSVPRSQFDKLLLGLDDDGPAITAWPIRNPTVAVLYTDPVKADRGRALFEGIMRTRLERLSTHASFALGALEQETTVAHGLEHLLRARPTLILVASTTAPAGPEDVVGRAMRRAGCRIEKFLAPVEPGNLMLLAYHEGTPVVAAPGCFRSPKINILDLVLPALLAGHPLTAAEISGLGHGGLLD